jgi:hypothetical protein
MVDESLVRRVFRFLGAKPFTRGYQYVFTNSARRNVCNKKNLRAILL